eukprot:5314072-Amphidinium_carterae.1
MASPPHNKESLTRDDCDPKLPSFICPSPRCSVDFGSRMLGTIAKMLLHLSSANWQEGNSNLKVVAARLCNL